MASRPPRAELQRPNSRLYLVAPLAESPSALARDIDGMIDAANIAAVLLRLPETDERTLIEHVKAIAPLVQNKDIALILDGHPEIAVRAGADGAHLTGIAALEGALGMLKPERIAGAGGLKTRHDAMVAGERGADYVMFGEPELRRPHLDAIMERIAWWAELFEPPCVGFAQNLDEVEALAAAGADFVAIEFAFTGAGGPFLIQAAAERIAGAELVR